MSRTALSLVSDCDATTDTVRPRIGTEPARKLYSEKPVSDFAGMRRLRARFRAGLAALNPITLARDALYRIVTEAAGDAAYRAVSRVTPELHAVVERLDTDRGGLIDAMRESEDRTRNDIAELRARFCFVGDPVDGAPDAARPRLEPTDTMNPIRVMGGPRLEQRGGFIGLSRASPLSGDGRRLTGGQPHP